MQEYIDAGWYTVPIDSEITRDDKGKKVFSLPRKNWKTIFTKKRNIKVYPCALVLTGKLSDIVVIDCDTQETFDFIRSLDRGYQAYSESVGKPSGGGSIFYRYNGIESFSYNNDVYKLDCLSDGNAAFLPTPANKTKKPWEPSKIKTIGKMPDILYRVLLGLSGKNEPKVETKDNKLHNRLAPLVNTFVNNDGRYSPDLFRFITPYDYRGYYQYLKEGHLEPNKVPVGEGSKYLYRVSCILGADVSINKELYNDAMLFINNLWETPMDIDRLNNTIILPMLNEQTKVNGKVIWQYDKHWQSKGILYKNKRDEIMESFFDDRKDLYYNINYTNNQCSYYSDKGRLVTIINTLTGSQLKAKDYDKNSSLVYTGIYPHLDFGHIGDTNKFNIFHPTKNLRVLNNPKIHEESYQEPKTIIKFLESLVPDIEMRTYLLRFVRTKLTTFEYSPVVLSFTGEQGSGKDTFVKLLGRIIGEEYLDRPSIGVFLETHNAWILDKFFVQLDDYAGSTTKFTSRKSIMSKLKSLTGSNKVQLRAMHTDPYAYEHNITFITTDNFNYLPLEQGDRRVALINTPNKLVDTESTKEIGQVIQSIEQETIDFCYYLATNFENLNTNEYQKPPDTTEKQEQIERNMPISDIISHIIVNNDVNSLENMFMGKGISDYDMGWESGRLVLNKIRELGECYHPKYPHDIVLKRLRDRGYKVKKSTTRENGKLTNITYIDWEATKTRQKDQGEIFEENLVDFS